MIALFLGKLMAVVIVVVAVIIAMIIPNNNFLYDPLPTNLTLNFTKPNTTIIVTGANSGVGFGTVQHFFAHNNEHATIIMACRSMQRCNTAKQQIIDKLDDGDAVKIKAAADRLRPMLLDLAEKSSIEEFALKLSNQQPIDILIHNAGISGPSYNLTYHDENGVELTNKINHLGPFYLTHCLWKNLLLADAARIVLVSSLAALPRTDPSLGWYKEDDENENEGHQQESKTRSISNLQQYGGSKRGNLYFAYELHQRYKYSTNISVTAAHPGFSHTNICVQNCKNQGTRWITNLELLVGTIKMTLEDGSLPQAYAAVIPQANVYLGPALYVVGKPRIVGTLDRSFHHLSFTSEESQNLWDKSMKAMGIETFGDFGGDDADATAEVQTK